MTRGGKREGSGRPPAEEPRDCTVAVRLTEAEYHTWEQRAGEESLSSWVRRIVNGKVRKLDRFEADVAKAKAKAIARLRGSKAE